MNFFGFVVPWDTLLQALLIGFGAWFFIRHILFGFFVVNQSERAVKTNFGRAQRLGSVTTAQTPIAEMLRPDERARYDFPQVRVLQPGVHFRWPWQKAHRVSIALRTLNMAWDPESRTANQGGKVLDAVTKDQLNTGLSGDIRWQVSERNLYAYLFGIKVPIAHVMGYFVSVLRERIANFEAPKSALAAAEPEPEPTGLRSVLTDAGGVQGVSINDLRKNLRDINAHMDQECRSSEARYGLLLDASLITGIDPPAEVESALAAINTAHNQVSSDISLAQAGADQKIVQSRRAVEIETLKAQAEVQPLIALDQQLRALKTSGGPAALQAYRRYVRLELFRRAASAVREVGR